MLQNLFHSVPRGVQGSFYACSQIQCFFFLKASLRVPVDLLLVTHDISLFSKKFMQGSNRFFYIPKGKKVPKMLKRERKVQKSERRNCMFLDSVSLKGRIFYGSWFNVFQVPPLKTIFLRNPPPQKKINKNGVPPSYCMYVEL